MCTCVCDNRRDAITIIMIIPFESAQALASGTSEAGTFASAFASGARAAAGLASAAASASAAALASATASAAALACCASCLFLLFRFLSADDDIHTICVDDDKDLKTAQHQKSHFFWHRMIDQRTCLKRFRSCWSAFRGHL